MSNSINSRITSHTRTHEYSVNAYVIHALHTARQCTRYQRLLKLEEGELRTAVIPPHRSTNTAHTGTHNTYVTQRRNVTMTV